MTALNPGYSLAGTPYKQLPTRPVMPHKDAILKRGDVLFKPTKKQAECIRLLSVCREVFFGGAAGGGKTYLMLAALTLWVRLPSFKAIILRLEWSQVDHFHGIAESLYFPLGAVFHGTKKVWYFPSGAEIHYGIFAAQKHENKYRGAYYNIVCWDEFGDWATMDYMKFMFTRIRYTPGANGERMPTMQFFTGNPGGINHSRLRKRFKIPDRPTETQILKIVDPKTKKSYLRAFVPSRLEDNPYLDPDYEERQRASGRHPAIIRAILEGRWDLSIGGAFVELWDENKHLIEPFDIPDNWQVWRGIDDGYNPDPFVTVWITQDPRTQKLYVIDEYTAYKALPHDIAPEILGRDVRYLMRTTESGKRVHVRHPLAGVADNSLFTVNNQNEGYGRGDQLNQEGLNLTSVKKGPGSRIGRAQTLRKLLADQPDGKPGILFFKGRCPGLEESIPTLPSDKLNPEDVDTLGPDHWYDALTYGIVGKPWTPVRLVNNITR